MINQFNLLNNQIPVMTLRNHENLQLVVACPTTDNEMLQVYQNVFLANIGLNQDARFVCTRAPNCDFVHVERLAVANIAQPMLPAYRVVCIYPEQSPAQEEITNRAGYHRYTSSFSIKSFNSTGPGILNQIGITESTMDELNEQYSKSFNLIRTIGLDRFVYQQVIDPLLPTAPVPIFGSNATPGVLAHFKAQKIEQLTINL